jgi:hypothetical protein
MRKTMRNGCEKEAVSAGSKGSRPRTCRGSKEGANEEGRKAGKQENPLFLLRNKNQFLLPLPRTKCRWGAAFLLSSSVVV